jgi:hypothetical protein
MDVETIFETILINTKLLVQRHDLGVSRSFFLMRARKIKIQKSKFGRVFYNVQCYTICEVMNIKMQRHKFICVVINSTQSAKIFNRRVIYQPHFIEEVIGDLQQTQPCKAATNTGLLQG